MKKTQFTTVALILILIHGFLFMILIKNSKNDLVKVNKMEKINHQEAISSKPRTINNIYYPSDEKGYMSINRPNKQTNKNYQQLISDPYIGAIVIDANTGKVLFQKHAYAYAYPASITKLMTLLLTLESLDTGDISLKDKVIINDEISNIGGSQLYLDPREKDFTVEDMLYAIMVHSANDAARALSIHVSGSNKKFVKKMNEKAKELGMNASYYHSEHGLPPHDDSQADISTAYDIGLLALACLRHPETTKYTGKELIYLGNRKFMCHARNHLVRKLTKYPGCDGLKTGLIDRGGWSIVATAKKNEQRIIAIILGCPEREIRDQKARELLDYGFKVIEK